MSHSILATQDAVEEIRDWKQRDRRPGSVFRIDVRLGGCRGFKLFFDLEEEALPDDVQAHFQDVVVVVQRDGLPLIEGAVLDFEDSYRGRGFRLANPNARNACGCGTSFMADYPQGGAQSVDGAEDLVVAEA
ncbi:MAG: HesB/IscA family protein [Candidatus Dormibacteria bacterium]